MSTTIHALSYKVLMDTRDFSEGSVLTRSELRKSKKAMEDAKTPAEKLEDEYKALAKAAQTGAIDQRAYNEQVGLAKERFDAAEKAGSGWTKSMEALNKSIGITKTVAAGTVGVITGMIVRTRQINDEVRQFEKFGFSATQGLGMFRVMAMDTGLEVEDFADALKDLRVRIGEADKDGGGIAETFDLIGFNWRKFKDADPITQMREFADAISRVESETAALQATDELLSDAGTKLFEHLREGAGAFDSAATKAELLGTNVTALDIARAEQLNQALNDSWLAMKSLADAASLEAAPLIEEFAEQAMDVFELGQRDRDKPAPGGVSVGLQTMLRIGGQALQAPFTGRDTQDAGAAAVEIFQERTAQILQAQLREMEKQSQFAEIEAKRNQETTTEKIPANLSD